MSKTKLLFIIISFSILASSVFPQEIHSLTNKSPLIRENQSSQLFINEFMANNILSYKNPLGEYEDWIEIYNSSDAPIDLTGYYLSDDLQSINFWKIPSGQPSLTTIPAKGFLILYADGKPGKGAVHLNFKLDNEKEKIFLIDKDGTTILDSITYQNQFRDISFGRFPDGYANWNYFIINSHGSKNQQGFTGFANPPSIEQASGFYTNNVTVSVTPNINTDNIFYTLDGSDPSGTSSKYTVPVQISQTSIFKARTINPGLLPSQIISKTFFVNANHSLPVLTLMTDPKNLFDPATGIYVNNKDGREWERFAELEYFRNKSLEFHSPAGLRIQGNTGPNDYKKKSFRAYFRKGYGEDMLNYQLYPNDLVESFNQLVFRAGYDDSMEPTSDGKNATANLLRDPIVTELWRQTGGLTPQSSFCVLYLNEKFNGIYDIKESIDFDFITDHLKYLDMDIFRTRWDSTELVYGNRNKWQELVSFFQNNTFVSDEKIVEAGKILDLDNFTTLQALVNGSEYNTWGYGVFMFREKTDAAKWQWTIWDADRSYNDVNWNGFTNQYNPVGLFLDNLITKKLLQNQSYKIKFINRIADLLNTTFSASNVNSIIDSLAQSISPEIPAEVSKWNNSVTKWNENVDYLRNFASQRPAIVRQQMNNYFHLNGLAELSVDISSGKGTIQINSVNISQFPWTGNYFKNIPVTVTAIPSTGYRFVGWSDPSLPSNQSITLNLTGDKTLAAIFTKLGNSNAELITPKRIRPGQHFPFIVRLRDDNWEINPIDQTPMQILFNGAHTDTTIKIKRGAGTGVVQINSTSDFVLSVQNGNTQPNQKTIEISSIPTTSYSGTLPIGDVVWDNTADRLITGNLNIPAGCNLIIKQGTWVVVKKYINFNVQGKITVEGTENEPVVITSEKWTEPWGGMEFKTGVASFRYCIVLNGGGDQSKGNPTSDGWHTGHQHIFFGKDNSEFNFDECFFLYSPGKVFGAQDSKVNVTNCVTSFVWLGGEFHRVLLSYKDSHLMNLPNDDHIYTEDIDTDGFHIDFVNPNYPQFSVIDHCYFITGKDDAIDHHYARLKISNCWLEDFIHEGVAASGGDTVKIFNTVSLKNDQGFEAGWTESGVNKGPFVFIDHCVAVDNNVGLRIGDSYDWTYKDFMKVTNSIIYNNKDNIWNYLNSTHAPLAGALDISYSMTNDADYNNSPDCITGVPQFDPYYYLVSGSPGINMGIRGTNLGRIDSSEINLSSLVINEIMYNASSAMNSKDWIELYNPKAEDQDISGWIIKDEDSTHSFQIPSNTIIPAGGYWVVCEDSITFKQIYPDVKNFSGNIPFGFGNNDQVRVFKSTGQIIDSVAYKNSLPWPVEADGKGYSLIIIDPKKDHSQPNNWTKSTLAGGSPGKSNILTSIEIKSEKVLPKEFVLEQNFPNPFNPGTTIKYSLPFESNIKVIVYNSIGQIVKELVNGIRQAGQYQTTFDGSKLSSGIYFYSMNASSISGKESYRSVKKMIILK
ncbi:MAG: lamin tail domain-containing protein [Ignavibacteriales bacterium]|nr:lamin tail domain-containing protein [Ignavibacteriales bacterium]